MIENKKTDNNIDIKEIITLYLRYWYVYIICVIIAIIAVRLYSRYIIPEYNTYATILIKDNKQNYSPIENLSNFSGVNGLRYEEVDNELLVLRSKRLLKKVVENLNLYSTFHVEGNILSTEIYNNLPIEIKVNEKDSTSTFSEDFILSFDNNNIYLQKNEEDEIKTYSYNQPIDFYFGNIQFLKKSSEIKKENNIIVNIADSYTVANRLKSNLSANRYEDYSSAIIISMKSPQKEKAKDIINDLIVVFNNDAIADKNLENKKTLEFINERIKIINNELGGVEENLSSYKQDNKVIDPLSTAEESIGEIKSLSKEILDLSTKEEFTSIYKNQIKNASIDEVLPSNPLSQNSELAQYVSEYNKIVIERNIQKQNATDLNPIIQNKAEVLKQLKGAIINSIEKENNLLQRQKSLINNKLQKYQTRFGQIPEQERILRSINRQQSIKENLYLLLLQKREETAISLATSAEKAKIIDAPESIGPTNTDFTPYYLGATLLGLLLPIGIIYLSTLLNTKIETRKDLSKVIGDYPILGELPSLKKDDINNVVDKDLSILSEAFRIIRTNLQFMLGAENSEQGKAILVTSTIKGEGKTFVSINLGHILSQLEDKKTIIIGADIRNPQLQRYFSNSKRRIGLTEYLYDTTVELDDIIITSNFDNRTSMILSGAIPPNPTELIMNKRLGTLIDLLKTIYDYIIIDSAPLLLVSDTYYISGLVDLSVIVARSRFTEKQLLEFPLKATKDNKLKHPAFILNDVSSKSSGYGYKYGYNYGYGYGYHNKTKVSILSKLKSIFNK
ncbi:polysaccharide biosynthesis tyrosine autokinase [Weeksellaceae bacterium TAE3-ERU29]|nr:polysaccharide biosynthesis tyrosine autokinase [Weeksellaceae bacterium TAE3-ERU29]